MKWKDFTEDDFQVEIEHLLHELEKLSLGIGYRVSAHQISMINKKFTETRTISDTDMKRFALAIEREISADHVLVSSTNEVLDEILGMSAEVAKKRRKPLDAGNKLTERMKKIPASLGPIIDQITFLVNHGSDYNEAAAYLSLLAFQIRWEVQGDYIGGRLVELSQKSLSQNITRRNRLIAEYLSIWGIADDGKPDSVHLRNAIAHGRFFTRNDIVHFEDVDKKGKTTYEDAKSMRQVVYELNNVFEKKVIILVLALTWIRFIAFVTRSPFYSGKT